MLAGAVPVAADARRVPFSARGVPSVLRTGDDRPLAPTGATADEQHVGLRVDVPFPLHYPTAAQPPGPNCNGLSLSMAMRRSRSPGAEARTTWMGSCTYHRVHSPPLARWVLPSTTTVLCACEPEYQRTRGEDPPILHRRISQIGHQVEPESKHAQVYRVFVSAPASRIVIEPYDTLVFCPPERSITRCPKTPDRKQTIQLPIDAQFDLLAMVSVPRAE